MIRTLVEQMGGTIDAAPGPTGNAAVGNAPHAHPESDGTEIHIVFPVSPSDE